MSIKDPKTKLALVSITACIGMNLATLAYAQTCTAAATGISFGVYSSLSATPTDTSGTVTVSCRALLSIAVAYTITLSAGSSGDVSRRAMAGSTPPQLIYQIYTDPTRTQIWGDGTGNAPGVADGYLLQVAIPVVRQYVTFARIPPRQLVTPGALSDTITVVITY